MVLEEKFVYRQPHTETMNTLTEVQLNPFTCASFYKNGFKYFLMIDRILLDDEREITIYEKREDEFISSIGITLKTADWQFLQSLYFKEGLRIATALLSDEDEIEKINTKCRLNKEFETANEFFELMLDKPDACEPSDDNPEYLRGVLFIISNMLHFLVHLESNSVHGRTLRYEFLMIDPVSNDHVLGFNWKPNYSKFIEIMKHRKFVIEQWLFNGMIIDDGIVCTM